MNRSIGLLVGTAAFLVLAFAGVPPAYAGCLDNAGDFIFGALSGGASVAACELKELIDGLKNLIQTVSSLATNVASNAKKITNAAIGAVNSAADDIANVVRGAQHDLAGAVSQAKTMTSTFAVAPLAVSHVSTPIGGAQPRGAVQPMHVPALAPRGGAQPGPNRTIAHAPVLLKADPQQLHAALERGLQVLSSMESRVDQDAASRIGSALQRARNQATSHLGDAANIVQTALLAPINALLNLLNDLVKHPSELLDPIATVNKMVSDISQNVTSTLNHINDVITQDAITTLGGIEADVQSVQSTAQEGGKLLGLMRSARQQGTQAALQALESELNTVAPQMKRVGQAHAFASLTMTNFRFAPVRSQLHATLAHAIAPTQSLVSNLSSSWAAIRARYPGGVRMHPLDPGSESRAKSNLDRMFLGKPPAEIARAKQDLLNRARRRYASNPQLMAAIQQNLDSYLRTHSLAGVRAPMLARPAPGPVRSAPNGIGIQAPRR